MVMKRLGLVLGAAVGIGILGLGVDRVAVGHFAADRVTAQAVTAQEPQVTRTEIALGRLSYHEAVGGPAIVAIQQFNFDPGARAGWHTHPGSATIVVTKGEMAFYEADGCRRTVFAAGSAIVEQPDQIHEPRNETTEPLEFYVTFIIPVGPMLRSAAVVPAACGG